jgi:transcriptional regulator with XRE-family HTH domain
MTTRNREQPPLGRRLVELRQRRRMSQSDLARYSGLSAGIIQSIEQGRRQDPHLSTLLHLCRGLNVSLFDLVGTGDEFLASLPPPPAAVSKTIFGRLLAS